MALMKTGMNVGLARPVNRSLAKKKEGMVRPMKMIKRRRGVRRMPMRKMK